MPLLTTADLEAEDAAAMRLLDEETCEVETLAPREVPDVKELLEKLQDDLRWSIDYVNRIEAADEVIEAYWEGQHDSGRKVQEEGGAEPFPFNGASDQRIYLAAEIVNEKVLLQKAALVNGASTFTPVESADAPDAALMQTLVGYFLNGPMKREVRDETDFMLNWKEGYGACLWHICWHEERAVEPRSITEDDLIAMAVQSGLQAAGLPAQEELAAGAEDGSVDEGTQQMASVVIEQSGQGMLDMLLDPARETELIAALTAWDPDITPAEAKRVAKELRTDRAGTYYAPYVKESRPKWKALNLMVDAFLPAGTTDIQNAPHIPLIHWLTASQVRDRAALKGWKPEHLAKVLAAPGRQLDVGMLGSGASWVLSTASVRRGMTGSMDTVDAESKLYEIIEVLHKTTTLAGAPAVFSTVIHGAVLDAPLEHEMQPYRHGKYPLVALRRERRKRAITESRGIPELVVTSQNSIKDQHDARRNRTDLAVSPPLIVATNRAGGRISIGPNMQISERRAGTLRWFEPPKLDMDSTSIIKDERAMIDMMFGRFADSVPQPVVQLHNQALVDDFLCDLSEAVLMTTQLIQQYVPEERASRIVGTKFTMDQTRAAIQAQWDLRITFDVRDFNLDWLKQKAEMITNFVLAADTLGVVDRAGYVQYLFRAIDPVMSQTLVKPLDQAQREQLAAEDAALTEIFSGGEPELIPGQNHDALAKRMIEKTQNSETRMQLYQTNGQIRKVWDNRLKFHRTQTSQQKNKQIGRVGGKPVLGEAMSEAGTLPFEQAA
jgi:hypothetical protein